MKVKFFVVVLCLPLFMITCDTYNGVSVDNFDEAIIGTWSRTDVIPSGRSEADFRYFDIVSTYSFNADATYSNKSDFFGFKDENPDEIMAQSITTGTFEIKGDSIFISARENTAWEKVFRPEPVMVQFEENEGFGNKFEILDKTLVLSYISFPADAPVPTQMSYDRVD